MPEPYVAIPAWHFKELVKRAREPKTTKTDNQQLQFRLRHTIQATKALLKEIEN